MAITDKLYAIADAIRSKTGGMDRMTPEQMAPQIGEIETEAALEELTVTENGEYIPGEGVDGFSAVRVNVESTGGGAYTNEQMLALLERTGTEFAIPEGTAKIGAGAFNGWSALTTLSIPETVTSVGSAAFGGCTNLVLKELPDAVTTISSSAFGSNGGCKYLERLPESLETIGQYAFEYSDALSITEIPAQVRSIGTFAFRGCASLTEITFRGTPAGMATNIFTYCGNLLTINVPWEEGAKSGAPWGATNATVNYNYTGG